MDHWVIKLIFVDPFHGELNGPIVSILNAVALGTQRYHFSTSIFNFEQSRCSFALRRS